MDISLNQIVAIIAISLALIFMLRDRLNTYFFKMLTRFLKVDKKNQDSQNNADCVLKKLLDFRSKFEHGGTVYKKLTEAIETVLKEEPLIENEPVVNVEEIDKIIEGLNELKKGR